MMTELIVAQYLPEARVIAQATGTVEGRAALLRDLEVEEPSGYPAGSASEALHHNDEAGIILEALRKAQVSPDTTIVLPNAQPQPGWYLTDLEGVEVYRVPTGKQKPERHQGDPRPLMMATGGELCVYERRVASGIVAGDGIMSHLYIPATATRKGDLAVMFGLAVVAAENELELPSDVSPPSAV